MEYFPVHMPFFFPFSAFQQRGGNRYATGISGRDVPGRISYTDQPEWAVVPEAEVGGPSSIS
jgi:hypothetical protein